MQGLLGDALGLSSSSSSGGGLEKKKKKMAPPKRRLGEMLCAKEQREVLHEEAETEEVEIEAIPEEEFDEVVKGSDLQTVVWEACARGKLGVLACGLKHASFDLSLLERCEPETGRRALHACAGAGSEPGVRMLLRAGADPNGRTAEGKGAKSPLQVAAQCGHYQCCRALLGTRGCRVDARASDGRTALHFAAEAASLETVRELFKAKRTKGFVEARDDDGRTPLHHACASLSYPVARELLNAGADRHALDAASRTPLDVARRAGAAPKLEKLLENDLLDDFDDEVRSLDEEAKKWEWVLVDRSGRMVETRRRKVALFRTAAAATKWAARLEIPSTITPARPPSGETVPPARAPARVARLEALLATVACERVPGDDDDDAAATAVEDPLWAEFTKRSKLNKESGLDVELQDALETLRRAERRVRDLRAEADEATAVAEMRELALVTIFAECQGLEAKIKAHEAALGVAPRGPDLLRTARTLADARHPAARDDADPGRFAAACAALVDDPQPLLRDTKETVWGPLKKTTPKLLRRPGSDADLDRTAEAPSDDPVPSDGVDSPVVVVPPPDPPDEEALLRELERELAAAGVRRHEKAAKLLDDEELTWPQLRAVFALSGPDGLKRTLAPIGLTAGAMASIEIRLASLS
ncbi:hypothetical protein CTAYLR_007988 [Chrysophaeum taylorii]|uniref:Uncharacterized protein n=1 Tax=Chrysophaeum taylorii TaxID=2483200 RepID=A0AAD7U6Z1_9STRA|nr:hypothetical protein CTAYLR_007988 [Chrysophaeum taylorii]